MFSITLRHIATRYLFNDHIIPIKLLFISFERIPHMELNGMKDLTEAPISFRVLPRRAKYFYAY